MFLAPMAVPVHAEENNIGIQSEGVQTNKEELQNFISRAREVSLEYSSSKIQTQDLISLPEVFNYTSVEGDTGYFYEKTSIDDKEFVATYPIEYNDMGQTDNISSDQAKLIAPASDSIPGGIGGRATVQKNGSIGSFVIHLPASTSGPTARTYIYSGFSGTGKDKSGLNSRTIETDMGMVYSNAYGVNKWHPIINYYWGSVGDGHTTPGNRISPYNEVWYKNGYIPGRDVNVTIYRNLNNNTRLSTSGYAYYANHDGTGTNSYLTAVTEIPSTYISSTTAWKYLATIADSVINDVSQGDAAGQITGSFSNIIIDSTAYTPVINSTDYANITISGNNVTVKVLK
jgi:hypothetical protein